MRISTHRIATIAALLALCLPADAADKLPVTLTISGPQTVPAGKKIEISAVLTNVTDHTVRIGWGDTYTLQIHDEHGKVLPLKQGLWGSWASGPATVAIEPGKSVTQPVGGDLSKYDLSAPGIYVVRVTRPLQIFDDRQHTIQSSTLESNQITMAITGNVSDKPPLALTISGPQISPIGKRIEVDAVLSNTTDHPITLMWAGVTGEIHDEHGNLPPLKPGLGSSSGPMIGPSTIEPGTRTMGALAFDKYDLSTPGVYLVQATCPVYMLDDQTPGYFIKSNQITIRIVAKDSDTPK